MITVFKHEFSSVVIPNSIYDTAPRFEYAVTAIPAKRAIFSSSDYYRYGCISTYKTAGLILAYCRTSRSCPEEILLTPIFRTSPLSTSSSIAVQVSW
jgi:hypothetical protein